MSFFKQRVYFGVDAHTLSNLKLRYIDFKKLKSKDNVKRVFQGDVLVEVVDKETGEIETFSYISITEEGKNRKIGKLMIGAKKMGEGCSNREYIILDIFVGDEKGDNTKPLTLKELEQRYIEILDYIDNEYGIRLTMKEAKYNYLEINKTFSVDRSYREYQGFLQLLPVLQHHRFRKNPITSNNKKDNLIDAVVFESGVMRIKVYNKTRQIKEFKEIEKADETLYLRFEVCLCTSDKIKEVFGTNRIDDITMEMLEEYFKKIMQEDIFDRFNSFIEVSNKAIVKEAKSLKKGNARTWTRDLISNTDTKMYFGKKEVDIIFDMEQVMDYLKANMRSDNYKNTIKRCKSIIDKKEHKKNNLLVVQEIKSILLND